MLSAICFNLNQSQILSSSNGLNLTSANAFNLDEVKIMLFGKQFCDLFCEQFDTDVALRNIILHKIDKATPWWLSGERVGLMTCWL